MFGRVQSRVRLDLRRLPFRHPAEGLDRFLAAISRSSFARISDINGRQSQCAACASCHFSRCAAVAFFGMRCLRCQAALIAMGSKSGPFEYSCQDNVALRHPVTTGAQSAAGRWRGSELRFIVSPIASYTKSTDYVMPTRWSNVSSLVVGHCASAVLSSTRAVHNAGSPPYHRRTRPASV